VKRLVFFLLSSVFCADAVSETVVTFDNALGLATSTSEVRTTRSVTAFKSAPLKPISRECLSKAEWSKPRSELLGSCMLSPLASPKPSDWTIVFDKTTPLDGGHIISRLVAIRGIDLGSNGTYRLPAQRIEFIAQDIGPHGNNEENVNVADRLSGTVSVRVETGQVGIQVRVKLRMTPKKSNLRGKDLRPSRSVEWLDETFAVFLPK
jgi:hypothetical protein